MAAPLLFICPVSPLLFNPRTPATRRAAANGVSLCVCPVFCVSCQHICVCAAASVRVCGVFVYLSSRASVFLVRSFAGGDHGGAGQERGQHAGPHHLRGDGQGRETPSVQPPTGRAGGQVGDSSGGVEEEKYRPVFWRHVERELPKQRRHLRRPLVVSCCMHHFIECHYVVPQWMTGQRQEGHTQQDFSVSGPRFITKRHTGSDTGNDVIHGDWSKLGGAVAGALPVSLLTCFIVMKRGLETRAACREFPLVKSPVVCAPLPC